MSAAHDGRPLAQGASWNVRGALIASLMLNLLLLGVFAGTVWATRTEEYAGKGRLGLLEFIETLPADRRDAIRGFIDTQRPRLRPLRQEVQAERTQAAGVLDADPLDKDKLATAMQRLSEAEHAFHSAINGVFIEAAARMTTEERRTYQAWWLERWSRRNARHDGRSDASDKPAR
jgi:uncharacterized membrane protein